MSRLGRLHVSTIKRNARKRGPISSDAWNDSFDEIVADLSNLYNEWNNFLEPLTSTIPDGTDDADVDAFADGLDGKTIYSDSAATESYHASYYDSDLSRPYTVLEQFEDLYTKIKDLETLLGSQISGTLFAASRVSIQDEAGYFTASTVEAALAELYSSVNTLRYSCLPLTGGTLSGNLSLGSNSVLFGTVKVLSSTGTPEGVIIAPMGSIYLNKNGGSGTTLYVKESGSGNTGWTAFVSA